MMLRRTLTTSISLVLVLIIFGCASPEYSGTKSFNGSNWHINDTATFEYAATDIHRPRNIFIELNHEDDYGYANIFLFCNINFPDGKIIQDTVQYILTNQNYEWEGSGSGSKTLKFQYKQNVSFPVEGKYLFKVIQAMRVGQDSILYGINHVKLTIE